MDNLHRNSFWMPIVPHHEQKIASVLLLTCLLVTCLLFMLTLCPAALADGEWGDLKGRFVYGGSAPAQMQLRIAKDQAVFGNKVMDESLLVNEENKGVANVVVYLQQPRAKTVPVHPSYINTANATIDLHIRNAQYSPRVLLVRTTQTILERSFDTVGHNTSVQTIANAPPGRLVSLGQPVKHRFSVEERIPSLIQCNIHPWMRAFVLIRSNPYMAASTADGYFEIKNLPAGLHTFRVWHERAGFVRNVKAGSHKIDDRGRMTLTVAPGENDLGNAVLPGELLKVVPQKEQR
jgi:hypothetical protein